MSSHYVLDIKGQKTTAKLAAASQRKVDAIGLRQESGHSATKAAEELSLLPGVAYVTLTLINETPIGVWKKGKRT